MRKSLYILFFLIIATVTNAQKVDYQIEFMHMKYLEDPGYPPGAVVFGFLTIDYDKNYYRIRLENDQPTVRQILRTEKYEKNLCVDFILEDSEYFGATYCFTPEQEYFIQRVLNTEFMYLITKIE